MSFLLNWWGSGLLIGGLESPVLRWSTGWRNKPQKVYSPTSLLAFMIFVDVHTHSFTWLKTIVLLRTAQLVLVPWQWLIGCCCTMGHHAGLRYCAGYCTLRLKHYENYHNFYNSCVSTRFMFGVLPCFGLSLGGAVIDFLRYSTLRSQTPALTRLKHYLQLMI